MRFRISPGRRRKGNGIFGGEDGGGDGVVSVVRGVCQMESVRDLGAWLGR